MFCLFLSKAENAESREREYEMMMNHLTVQIKDKDQTVEDLKINVYEKEKEIDNFDIKLMKIKDEQMDY